MVKLDLSKVEFEDSEYDSLGNLKPAEANEPDEPAVHAVLTDENITQEQINEMKMYGMDKPETVSSERWHRLQGIRYEHELMIEMAAVGRPQKDIAAALGYDPMHVSKALNTPDIREKINKKISEIFGEDIKKALKAQNMKAIGVVSDVLNTGKESERASMAKWVIEHSVGKASQDVHVTKTTLVEFIHKVEEMQQNQLRDVNGTFESLPKDKDHFDNIIDQVIPQGMIVGKRSGGDSEGKT